MPTMCNACGAIYELWSEAIECHPDVVEVSEEQFAEYKAAQPRVQPTLLTHCPYCNREHDSRLACPEYAAKSQSG